MARRPFSLVRSAGWSLTWAVGAAIGVALGAYLTAVSGNGAPGPASLDRVELVVLPLLVGLAVFVVSLLGRIVFAYLARDDRSRDGDEREGDQDGRARDGVVG